MAEPAPGPGRAASAALPAASRHSVRIRLLVIALLPMLILMPLLIGVTMQRWIWRTDQILTARAGSDLTVAQQYLAHLVENTGQGVEALAQSTDLADVLTNGLAGARDTTALLAERRARLGLDLLILTPMDAPPLPADPLLAEAAAGRPSSGIALLSSADLARLDPRLAGRARIALTGSAAASATGGIEERGLMVLAISPVAQPGGGAGLLIGGILLNRNEGFVDRINDLVYPASTAASPPSGMAPSDMQGFDRGVTTLFLGDTRIATTLRPGGGERALGTRASEAVRQRVLVEGGSWRDTAYVVNGWYISAYEAITDARGQRIGMLYTGFPKAPYIAARRLTWSIIGLAFLAVAALSVPLFLYWARGIFRPIEAMGATITLVEAGDMGARSGPQPGADEIVHLARHLDRLLDLLEQRDRELRGLNNELNARVEARTADLSQANLALRAATRQLILSEKLATIGEVTTGIAHEINNPLAVIQGNLEVLRMVVDDRMDEAAVEFRLIDDQITRIGALVRQLLQFARPEEFADMPGATDPALVAQSIRPLVQHLLGSGITLEIAAASTAVIRMNPHELQQILVNLIGNAVQAMPAGGVIRVATTDSQGPEGSRSAGQPGILLRVSDSGTGMPPEVLARIFDPFFTTRGVEGTGLGLAICQTLVSRQGGEIRAESSEGQGTSFSIWLPAADGPGDGQGF